MRILEITKNHSYWGNNPHKNSPYIDHALKLAKHWDTVWDYFFDNEDTMSNRWPFQEEEKIFKELSAFSLRISALPRDPVPPIIKMLSLTSLTNTYSLKNLLILVYTLTKVVSFLVTN